jgi:hypothetical protein
VCGCNFGASVVMCGMLRPLFCTGYRLEKGLVIGFSGFSDLLNAAASNEQRGTH